MNRFSRLLSAFLVVFFVVAPSVRPAEAADKPNIIIITADNLGYADLGCYGNKAIITPRIDQLASQSARCTQFYTASPTCTVSRATLLTGRVPQRIKLNKQLSSEENLGVGLRQSEWLIPRYLKKAGYATACFGKWNIGFALGSRPTERGFDQFFGHASGNIDYYSHVYAGRHDMYRGTKPAHEKGYSTQLFADAACGFIQEEAGKDDPFFIYLPFNSPHFPSARNKKPGQPNIWQAPDESFARYGWSPDEQDPNRRYYAVVTALDDAIGQVVDQIENSGIAENTLVVFFSDNGAFMLPNKGLEVSSNKPLRSGGVTLWEGGIRVPCMVTWPKKIEAGSVVDQPWVSLDLLPLCLQIAGLEKPNDRVLDGKNPLPLLQGEAASPHDYLAFQFRKYSSLRKGDYKILKTKPNEPWKLFDLKDDVGESTDIAAAHPQMVTALSGQFDEWLARTTEDR